MSKRVFSALCSLFLAAFLLAGCSGSQSMSTDYYPATGGEYAAIDEMAPEEAPAADAGSAQGPGLSLPKDDRMVVLNAYLTIEAVDFTATCQAVEDAVSVNGGYISNAQLDNANSSYYDRSASFTARVPADRYRAFLEAMDGTGNLVSRSESSEDVTSTYVDLEARLTSLRTQEERLLALMDEAGDLEDLLALQNQLTDVQYEIESYTAQRNSIDQLVSYSTVEIYIYEVTTFTEAPPETYSERIQRAFYESWLSVADFIRELSIFLVYSLPAILVLLRAAVLVVIAITLSRRKQQKKGKDKNTPPKTDSPSE